jgi:hypothetical protein
MKNDNASPKMIKHLSSVFVSLWNPTRRNSGHMWWWRRSLNQISTFSRRIFTLQKRKINIPCEKKFSWVEKIKETNQSPRTHRLARFGSVHIWSVKPRTIINSYGMYVIQSNGGSNSMINAKTRKNGRSPRLACLLKKKEHSCVACSKWEKMSERLMRSNLVGTFLSRNFIQF